MAPHLDTIPSEILEDIAFHTSYDVRPRPPSDLISLLLVNRKLKSALSFHTTPHLYARIFTSKFDSEAHIRRLGPYKTQSNHLATELKRRFTVLRRVRAHEACSFPHSHPTGHDLEVIHEILWTVYVMMLENDGLNEKQLLEFAHINVWLGRFWFDSNGTSWAMKALDSDAWPPNHDIATLAMWNFWLLLRPDDYLTIGISQLRAMVAILKAFAIGAHKYTIIPDAFAKDSSPLHAPESLPSYGTYPPISPLPLAFPAILSFLALVPLFSKRQATISDSIPTPSLSLCQKSPLSREWDNEWSRSALFADPMASVTPHSRPFLPGSVTGIWEGMFTYIDFSVYASLLGGATPSKLVATPAARHQQTFRLREYHLLNPGVGNFGDEPRPLSYGNPLRAGLPDEVEFILNGANLRVIEPGHPDIVYHLAPPCESTSADYVSRIRDVLIIGEGHSAWGQFNLLGRVKAQDGFISISKEYIDDDRGTWLYRGYLVGTKYGNLTGRWRDTLSPHDQLGYEGCFFMGRRT